MYLYRPTYIYECNVMVRGCSVVRLFVYLWVSDPRPLHSVRFGQLLRCAHKLFVNIMKLYIERNYIQVELIGSP